MAITVRGFSNAVAVTTGNITLSEPAGTAQGDLLIASIAHRGTVGYNTPSGWTRVIDESSGNTSTTESAGIGSMEVFWIRRGASAPALQFNVAGTTTVGLARLIAYSNVSQANNPIRSSANRTMPAANTLVQTSGNVVGSPGQMVVVMEAGGSDNVCSNWTIPAGTVTFTEVFDSNTTNGSDTTNALANLVLTSALDSPVRLTTGNSRNVIGVLVLGEDMMPDAGACSVVITGYEPTVVLPISVATDAGSVSLQGYAPSVSVASPSAFFSFLQLEIGGAGAGPAGSTSVTPANGALALQGYSPQVDVPVAYNEPVSLSSDLFTPPASWFVDPGIAAVHFGHLYGVAGPQISDSAAPVDTQVVPGAAAVTLQTYAPSVSAQLSSNPSQGSVAITGLQPSVLTQTLVTPSSAQLAISGCAPQALVSIYALPAAASASITGYQPTVLTPQAVYPAFGQVQVQGYQPAAAVSISIASPAGQVAISGYAPQVLLSLSAAPAAGQVVIQGYAPGLQLPASISVPAAQLAITGYAPSSVSSLSAAPGAGSVTIAGYAPAVLVSLGSAVPAGALALQGYAPSLLLAIVIQPPAGLIALSGAAPSALLPGSVQTGQGSISLAGWAPSVATSGIQQVTVPAGQLQLQGWAPSASSSSAILAQPGAGQLQLAGYAPSLLLARYALPGAAGLTLTGYAPTIAAPNNQAANPASGAVSTQGWAPTITRQSIGAPAAGNVALQGYAPSVTRTIGISVPAGQVGTTGYAPTVVGGEAYRPGVVPWLDGVGWGRGNKGGGARPNAPQRVEYVLDRTYRENSGEVEQRPSAQVIQLRGHAPSIQLTQNHVISPPTARVGVAGRKVVSLVEYRANLATMRQLLPTSEEIEQQRIAARQHEQELQDRELMEFAMMVANGFRPPVMRAGPSYAADPCCTPAGPGFTKLLAGGGGRRIGGRRHRAVMTRVGQYVAAHEKSLAKKIERVLRKHAAKVAQAVAAEYASFQKDDRADLARRVLAILNGDSLSKQIVDILRYDTESAFRAGADNGFSQVGFDATEDATDQVDAEAAFWAANRGGELIKDLAGTTDEAMRELLFRAIDEGMGPDDLAAEIEEMGAFGEVRAATIARTELAFAHVNGNVEGWRATGEVVGKRAILGDLHEKEDICDECVDAGVVGLDEDFVDGYSQPPFHPNCWCDVVPVLRDEMDEGD